MKLVLGKLEDGEELSSKELASISSALAGYERNRIAAAREDAKRDYAAKEAEYQAKIAELSATVQAITEQFREVAGRVDNQAVIDEMNKAVGLH